MPDVTKKIVFGAKIALFCLLVGFIAYTLRQQTVRWADLREPLLRANYRSGWAVLMVGLLPVNWSLEALKWRWLVRRVTPLRFGEALGGVLAGLSLGMMLPGALGDTAGRVLSIRAAQRTQAVGAALVAGGMQFYAAVVAGTAAWATYLYYARNTPASHLLLAGLVGLTGLGVVLNFYRHRFVGWSARWPWLGRYVAWWRVIGQYSHADMLGTFGLALLRHLTFSAQLYAAFRLYDVPLAALPLAAGISVIYLLKIIAPPLNFVSDLGVREAAALWVFAPFGLPAPPLLAATLTLWFVNIGLPMVVGLGLVARIKLGRTRPGRIRLAKPAPPDREVPAAPTRPPASGPDA